MKKTKINAPKNFDELLYLATSSIADVANGDITSEEFNRNMKGAAVVTNLLKSKVMHNAMIHSTAPIDYFLSDSERKALPSSKKPVEIN